MPSETGASVQAPNGLQDAAVRAQLERILDSEVFSRSQQLRRFLSFVVEQTLIGQGQTLKESVLAHELYGKGADFDGGTDPVVRVDARRLRDKLREYYEGRSEPVIISLPKGSYVPIFEVNSVLHSHTENFVAVTRLQAEQPRTSFSRARPLAVGIAMVAVIAAVIALRSLVRSAGAPMQLLPLASYPGAEGPPALSPDGNLVAFAWSAPAGPDQSDIYVKAIGSETLRPLTETAASENNPAWSPDGHSIAFVRDGNGVFTVSQLGGDERQVSASGTHVAWAADSKSVLIRDRESITVPFGIYQVFLDTLERRQLTQAPLGIGDYKFDVSPDGKTLAFIRYDRPGISDLYVVAMRGGEPRRLSNWNATLTSLSWTPDGREIVYSVEEPAANRLWRIPVDSSRLDRGSLVAGIPMSAVHLSISRPKGSQPARLAFRTVTSDVDLQMIDLEARVVNDTIESKPFSNSTRVEGSARFSPDGSRIAIMSLRGGSPDIWVTGRDGSGLRQVTSLGAPEIVVGGWSPDGESIVFDASVDGNSDVYVVGADGGHLRRLTSESSLDGLPSWSADGRWIYFASTRGGSRPDIWRMPANGGEAVRMTHNGGLEPKESLDGRYLFYLDRQPAGAMGPARLMRAALADGEAEPVVEVVRPFLWSVTTTGIVFVTRESDFDAIDVYRFSDRRINRVGRLGFRLPGSYTHMTASRDGRWVLATKMVWFDSDLMRIDNFR